MTTKQVIYDMAKEQGYEGGEPRTTTEAINILADMLAGEDVEEGSTIKGGLAGSRAAYRCWRRSADH